MTEKRPDEMTLSEFAANMRLTAGLNRLPSLGGKELYSYSVYANGKFADQLPLSAREHEFRDVALQSVTERVGLDPQSQRDNLRMAEILSTRDAWMSTVLEASYKRDTSELIQNEYALVSNDLRHPWIQQQISEQRALSHNLAPALREAEKAIGTPIKELPAADVSTGVIVSRNDAFTVQQIGKGEVVAHENSRLTSSPQVGDNVIVSYYRGEGTVINNGPVKSFSEPYVDQHTKDLAIKALGADGEVRGVLLFNSAASFVKFAQEHNLNDEKIHQALDARMEARRTGQAELEPRVPTSDVYIDQRTKMLAVNYKEGSATFTALFKDAEAVKLTGHAFGLTQTHEKAALKLEREPAAPAVLTVNEKMAKAFTDLPRSEAQKLYPALKSSYSMLDEAEKKMASNNMSGKELDKVLSGVKDRIAQQLAKPNAGITIDRGLSR